MTGDLARSAVGSLSFKTGGTSIGHLIFKREAPGETLITFAWGPDGKDLDILAYWEDEPTLTCGYKHGSGGTSANGYKIVWSGDIKGTDQAEWVRVSKTKWGNSERKFIVHLNFYGYDPADYPADTCTVIVSQLGGKTITYGNQPCATRHHYEASYGDTYVEVTFDEGGVLKSAVPKVP